MQSIYKLHIKYIYVKHDTNYILNTRDYITHETQENATCLKLFLHFSFIIK